MTIDNTLAVSTHALRQRAREGDGGSALLAHHVRVGSVEDLGRTSDGECSQHGGTHGHGGGLVMKQS